ncbi:hypothetical protein PRIPAC_83463 [Pristionchus pacificus]|uniref:Uncharacterized protein n=1 Tax=Pristionchus pacificus TaxID=54126 RepID=A0A2A6BTZ7_PRIPA|nr:hypothetical protein PRIPAC_83463 [Pristionchus pacificus]|eukprot:PDM69375.1 hypothetical protein PRIPAC_47677 [Pristionchus pacificus]
MSQTDPTSSNDKKEEELSKFIDRIQSIPSTSMEGAGYVTIEQLHTVNEERLEDQEAILERIAALEQKIAALTDSNDAPKRFVEKKETESESESEDYEVLLKHIERLASIDNTSALQSSEEPVEANATDNKQLGNVVSALASTRAELEESKKRIVQLEREKAEIKRKRDEFAQKSMGNRASRGFRKNNLMGMFMKKDSNPDQHKSLTSSNIPITSNATIRFVPAQCPKASEFAKRMQKIPTSVEANKKFEQIEHVEAVDFDVLSEPEMQRFKQLESALALTQSSLAQVRDRNLVLEKENVDLKRKLDESKKAYNRLVSALDNVLQTAKV